MEERRKSDLKELQLRQKEAELKRESLGSLQQFLKESRKKLENLVRELKEGEVDREKTLKVKDFLNELNSYTQTENESLEQEEYAIKEQLLSTDKNISGCTTELVPGMEVFAGTSKQRGTIIRADKKDTWLVEIGSLKMSFSKNELIPAGTTQKVKSSWTAEYGASNDAVYELRIRGMRFEEAMEAVRRQVDAAVLSGLKNFSVIHGKGHGILRQGVHDYLRENPAVADFHFARPEVGGFGKTEVVLK
jgi:DNA mismatch repair protein MutS2